MCVLNYNDAKDILLSDYIVTVTYVHWETLLNLLIIFFLNSTNHTFIIHYLLAINKYLFNK